MIRFSAWSGSTGRRRISAPGPLATGFRARAVGAPGMTQKLPPAASRMKRRHTQVRSSAASASNRTSPSRRPCGRAHADTVHAGETGAACLSNLGRQAFLLRVRRNRHGLCGGDNSQKKGRGCNSEHGFLPGLLWTSRANVRACDLRPIAPRHPSRFRAAPPSPFGA